MLFIASVHAADKNGAYNLICKTLTFEDDKINCMEKIRNYKYFDDGALAFCKGLAFSDEKISCLDLIGDKKYESYEMDFCLKLNFESEKRECLKNYGTSIRHEDRCRDHNKALGANLNTINGLL